MHVACRWHDGPELCPMLQSRRRLLLAGGFSPGNGVIAKRWRLSRSFLFRAAKPFLRDPSGVRASTARYPVVAPAAPVRIAAAMLPTLALGPQGALHPGTAISMRLPGLRARRSAATAEVDRRRRCGTHVNIIYTRAIS